MDKHSLLIVFWFVLLIFYVLGTRALLRGYADGEFTHSGRGSFRATKIRRDDDPGRFQGYLLAMVLINVVFLVVLIVLGIGILWGWTGVSRTPPTDGVLRERSR